MPTLNQVTKNTKKLIRWGLIILGVVIIIFLGIRAGLYLKEALFPTPPAPPTVSFGKLSAIVFPESKKVNTNLTYFVDTLTGELPKFEDRATVYKTNEQKSDLLAFQKAKEKAKSIKFSSEPITLSDGVYEWRDQDLPGKKLTINTLTSRVNLDSNFYTDEKIISRKNLPSENEALSVAKSFLVDLSLFPESLDETKTKTALFTIKNYVLFPATSFAESQLIRVSFLQKDINEKPIFYENPDTSNINLYITGGDRTQIVKADYFYHQILNESATYPIKTTTEAFKDLQEGKAFFAKASSAQEEVSIKDVKLGYFIPNNPHDYLMPIYVFEGDGEFFAYVSAVRDEWLDN